MSDLSLTLWKKPDPHVLTFAPLRVVLKPCDHLATPAGSFHAWNMLDNNLNLNYNLWVKTLLSVEKPSRDEAIKISPKQKFLKPLWMYY